MMGLLLVSLVASPVDGCPFNAVCSVGAHSASATIRLTLTLESAHQASVNVNRLVPGEPIYEVAATNLTTGMPDAAFIEFRYLVFDPGNKLNTRPLMIAFYNHRPVFDLPYTVVVMEWPKYLDRNQMIAMVMVNRHFELNRPKTLRI